MNTELITTSKTTTFAVFWVIGIIIGTVAAAYYASGNVLFYPLGIIALGLMSIGLYFQRNQNPPMRDSVEIDRVSV